MSKRKPQPRQAPIPVARIESIRVENFRALQSVTLDNLTPLTVLLGPNGSGKSTIFDVFNFLSECFQVGLRRAWDLRMNGRELKSRGHDGPVTVELVYRGPDQRSTRYHLAIDDGPKGPIVKREWLEWVRGTQGRPFRFLDYEEGHGTAISGEVPDHKDKRISIPLRSPDLIAVNTLGQIAEHSRVAALREFITDWYVSYLSVEETRSQPLAGPQEKLNKTGSNIANVLQNLAERDPKRLEEIFTLLRARVPRIDHVLAKAMDDGRLLLTIKDAPFERPVLARFASDGTLKMLAYLLVLHAPERAQFIGIEEPENFLHPRLLPGLAEECRTASDASQLLVTTHSPFFLNGLRAEEVRVLHRDDRGFTQVTRASDIPGVPEFIQEGALLGDLWMEGHLGGDPLVRSGAPARGVPKK